MAKIIKLTESDLELIVKRVIKEQSVIGAPNYGVQSGTMNPTTTTVSPSLLPCVPTAFKLSVQNFIKKNYNKTFLKAALGIIGRESDFGDSNRFKFTAPLKALWAALGGQTSVGYAQIKPETAEKYGIKVKDLELASGSLEAAYKILQDNYNAAIKIGYTEQPSSNLKDGTGNSALDIAIAAYNLGASKITKYCKTNDPKINRPCSMSGKKTDEGLTVTNQHVPNYIPNFKTERWDGVKISSHGYISEVAQRIKGFTCF